MPHHFRRYSLLHALVCLGVMAGCASSVTTGSISPGDPVAAGPDFFEMSESQLQSATSQWTQSYQKRPGDRATALTYAQALRAGGRHEEAVAVIERTLQGNESDPVVLLAYAKALTGIGKFDQALLSIKKAQVSGGPSWDHYSVEGAILDQMGRAGEARQKYNQALALSPNNPVILNNMGTSYLLSGDLQNAERTLRVAVSQPGAGQRPRQNLALVLALQGRFEESERIAAENMTPQQAAENVAYVKSMLRQTDTWSKIRDQG